VIQTILLGFSVTFSMAVTICTTSIEKVLTVNVPIIIMLLHKVNDRPSFRHGITNSITNVSSMTLKASIKD